jgi:hypothetical protein
MFNLSRLWPPSYNSCSLLISSSLESTCFSRIAYRSSRSLFLCTTASSSSLNTLLLSSAFASSSAHSLLLALLPELKPVCLSSMIDPSLTISLMSLLYFYRVCVTSKSWWWLAFVTILVSPLSVTCWDSPSIISSCPGMYIFDITFSSLDLILVNSVSCFLILMSFCSTKNFKSWHSFESYLIVPFHLRSICSNSSFALITSKWRRLFSFTNLSFSFYRGINAC